MCWKKTSFSDRHCNDKDGEIGSNEFEFNTHGRLDYDFYFKTLASTVYFSNGHEYSTAHAAITFNRTDKSQQRIFVEYHMPTGIFASLSLLSYFIPTGTISISENFFLLATVLDTQ